LIIDLVLLGTVGLLKNMRLLRRYAPRNDKRCVFKSLRAWPQGADSKNRAAISGVTVGLFQQPRCPSYSP